MKFSCSKQSLRKTPKDLYHLKRKQLFTDRPDITAFHWTYLRKIKQLTDTSTTNMYMERLYQKSLRLNVDDEL
jgi:DUF971 family protein